ncbi:MAG TPA: DUF1554 domain-containing protein [Leptospiraceae bacterium]|nr:DUF1554 domain-containing protein [Leptospiraceae bacterium]
MKEIGKISFRIVIITFLIELAFSCTVRPKTKILGLFSLVNREVTISYNLGGTVSGLQGTLILQNNMMDRITIEANGNFTFTNLYPTNSNYSVTVFSQPSSQTCSITNGSGTILSSSISNISVRCGNTISSLSSLTISSGTITPSFSSSLYSYSFSVLNSASSITITPTATDASATITVNGSSVLSGSSSSPISLSVGSNTISIVVKASDGITTSTYTLTVIRSTLNAYRIFITASTYDGNLIGTSSSGYLGADSKCNSDANKPTDGSIYKAVITDVVNRSACSININCTNPSENLDWALRTNTSYARTDGTALFTTNAAGIFVFGTLTNSFGGGQYWTGISTVSSWRPSTGGNNYSEWSSNSGALNGNYGDGSVTNYTSIAMTSGACNNLKSLLCAEQ